MTRRARHPRQSPTAKDNTPQDVPALFAIPLLDEESAKLAKAVMAAGEKIDELTCVAGGWVLLISALMSGGIPELDVDCSSVDCSSVDSASAGSMVVVDVLFPFAC